MTLSAWIRPAAIQSGWRTTSSAKPTPTSSTPGQRRTAAPIWRRHPRRQHPVPERSHGEPVNAWTYVAFTYDGANLRLFINGTQVATRAATGAIQTTNNPLWIGGNSPYGEYFRGLIDEVRVYNRALAQADVQADMNTGIGPTAADTTPPTAPTGLRDRGSSTQVNLGWTASTDNVGVTDTASSAAGLGLHELRPARDADRHLVQRHRPLALDHLPLPGARRRRGRQPRARTPRSPPRPLRRPRTRRRRRRRRALTATAVSTTQINLGWTASTDNVGVTGYRVERCEGPGCTNFAQVATPTGTSFNDTGLPALDHLPLPGARRRRGRQPGPVLHHRHRHHSGGPGHDAADGADRAHRDGGRARPRSTSAGPPRPTTSA